MRASDRSLVSGSNASLHQKDSNADMNQVMTPAAGVERDTKEEYGYTIEGRRPSRMGKRVPKDIQALN